MPDAQHFLDGFNFKMGTVWGNYKLMSAKSTHEMVKQYNEYKYHLTLTFHNYNDNSNEKSFLDKLNKTISKSHTIYGIRNPYKCVIDKNSLKMHREGNDIIVKLTGHAYRIYKK